MRSHVGLHLANGFHDFSNGCVLRSYPLSCELNLLSAKLMIIHLRILRCTQGEGAFPLPCEFYSADEIAQLTHPLQHLGVAGRHARLIDGDPFVAGVGVRDLRVHVDVLPLIADERGEGHRAALILRHDVGHIAEDGREEIELILRGDVREIIVDQGVPAVRQVRAVLPENAARVKRDSPPLTVGPLPELHHRHDLATASREKKAEEVLGFGARDDRVSGRARVAVMARHLEGDRHLQTAEIGAVDIEEDLTPARVGLLGRSDQEGPLLTDLTILIDAIGEDSGDVAVRDISGPGDGVAGQGQSGVDRLICEEGSLAHHALLFGFLAHHMITAYQYLSKILMLA